MKAKQKRWTETTDFHWKPHREPGLQNIQSERFRVAATRADELQFEHDFGATSPILARITTEKTNGRTNHN